MFDFAFSELVVILLVALIVVGPERLPKVARTAGHLWGRAQRYVHNIKNDIANDMAIEEASQLRDTVSKEIAAIGQTALDAKLTAEQEILQARHARSPDTPDEPDPSATQSSAVPGKPV